MIFLRSPTLFITTSNLLNVHKMLGRYDTRGSESGKHIILLGFPHISNALRSQVARFPLARYHCLGGIIGRDHAHFGKAFHVVFPDELSVGPCVITPSYVTQ